MTRRVVFAILAFSLLIVANLAVFGFLSFRSLSKQMVTEELMQGLREAQRTLSQQNLEPLKPEELMQQLAPRLKNYRVFQAVVLIGRSGEVQQREILRREVAWHRQGQEPNFTEVSKPGYQNASNSLRHLPLQTQDGQQMPRLALEYDQKQIDSEVAALRKDLNTKLAIAIGVSLLLLSVGLIFVVSAYRRSQAAQAEARKADRLAYVGTLSSGLAHEIRNPLNSMNMNVQLIQEELEELGAQEHEDLLDMLEGTRKEVMRLESLVSSFLAYARPTDLVLQPTSLNELISDIIQFLDAEIATKGVLLETHYSDDLPMIPLDEAQMRQAFLNVIQNGIQVLQKDQRLTITTRKAGGDKVLVIIADEGPGIVEEERANIFKEFYSTKHGGTGLGLPIAQRIAELHMGGIKLESEVGKGTTVTFILPMEQSA